MNQPIKTSDYNFYLPQELIAYAPAEKRDHSRLMVLSNNNLIQHRNFFDLPEYLQKNDLLILNDTKVTPVRLSISIERSKQLDVLALSPTKDPLIWKALYRGRYTGTAMWSDLKVHLIIADDKTKYIRFFIDDYQNLIRYFWQHGKMPLPPYIKRDPSDIDKERYQTVYAVNEGSIAAPTAGIHFTNELFQRLSVKGVIIKYLTLHINIGTFKPIRSEFLHQHNMDKETFCFEKSLIDVIMQAKERGSRVVAVGTTTTRTLEGYFSGRCEIFTDNESDIISGQTDIFIYPGYEFKVIDGIITNFHLPHSTPLMLVSAFIGWNRLHSAYKEAIKLKYRFFSYGDAMVILK